MKCNKCGADKILSALIYDKAEQKLYKQYFDNMVELNMHLAIMNIRSDAVLILKEITRPSIGRREVTVVGN